jgi:hypothetical protein
MDYLRLSQPLRLIDRCYVLIAIAHLTSAVFPLVIAANRREFYASSDAAGACVDRGSQRHRRLQGGGDHADGPQAGRVLHLLLVFSRAIRPGEQQEKSRAA